MKRIREILEKEDSEEGFKEFVQILEQNPNTHADEISLFLRWAVKNQKKLFADYYRLLVKHGANINFVDLKEKKSNLMIACELKREDIVEVLSNDPNINFLLEDSTNKNALLYAINNRVKSAGEKYVRILLKKCPELLKNNKNLTRNNPLELAISQSKVEIVKALLEEGANPNEPINQKGTMPLQEAVKLLNQSKQKQALQKKQPLQIVQLLLEKGADPAKISQQGDKFIKELEQICLKAKASGRAAEPVMTITNVESNESFAQDETVQDKPQRIVEAPPEESSSQEDLCEDMDPFEHQSSFKDGLSTEIDQFAAQCLRDYMMAGQQLSSFLHFLKPICTELSLEVEIYGSYATGLWITQCDIDIMLIPTHQYGTSNSVWYLESILQRFKGTVYEKAVIFKNPKIPLIRVPIGDDRDGRRSQKLDISVLSANNTGRQHSEYVRQFLQMYPCIKPLFYVIKKLSHCYRLYDPSKSGVRSFALFLMLAIFMQHSHAGASLGEQLLGFLYKYGFNYDFYYIDEDSRAMVLNLYDPVNPKNNLGKNTDAYALQRMFKAAYLVLHARGAHPRLECLFESRQMFC